MASFCAICLKSSGISMIITSRDKLYNQVPTENINGFGYLCKELDVDINVLRKDVDSSLGLPFCKECETNYKEISKTHLKIQQLKSQLKVSVSKIREKLIQSNNEKSQPVGQILTSTNALVNYNFQQFRAQVIQSQNPGERKSEKSPKKDSSPLNKTPVTHSENNEGEAESNNNESDTECRIEIKSEPAAEDEEERVMDFTEDTEEGLADPLDFDDEMEEDVETAVYDVSSDDNNLDDNLEETNQNQNQDGIAKEPIPGPSMHRPIILSRKRNFGSMVPPQAQSFIKLNVSQSQLGAVQTSQIMSNFQLQQQAYKVILPQMQQTTFRLPQNQINPSLIFVHPTQIFAKPNPVLVNSKTVPVNQDPIKTSSVPSQVYCRFCRFSASSLIPSTIRYHEMEKHDNILVFCCKHCSRRYSSLQHLVTHLNTHSSKGPFNCSICQLSFSINDQLEEHLVTQHIPSKTIYTEPKAKQNKVKIPRKSITTEDLTCSECGKVFEMLCRLKDHLNKKHLAYATKCELCEFKGSTAVLVAHIQKSHEIDGEKVLECSHENCVRKYATKYMLQRHLKTHRSKIEYFYCDFCDDQFQKEEALKRHVEMIHENQPKIKKKTRTTTSKKPRKVGHLPCEVCEKIYSSGESLAVHKRNSHPELLVYECGFHQCNKKYFALEHLETHYKIHVQPNEGESIVFKCNICIREFISAKDLSEHLIRHTGEFKRKPKMRHECMHCHKKYLLYPDFKAHMIEEHDGVGLTSDCEICGQKFLKKAMYLIHVKRHSEPKKKKEAKIFSCDFCEKKLTNRRDMELHIKVVHEGQEKPMTICEVCGKSMGVQSIKHHMDRKHPKEELKFKCYFCDKRYVTFSSLCIHVVGHTMERPFICQICHKDFTQGHCLVTHLKSHNENNDNVTNDNDNLFNLIDTLME